MSRPVAGCTAEETQPVGLQRIGYPADLVALVQRLRPRIEFETSAFYHRHLRAGTIELQRHRDPDRARSDYAHVGFDQVPFREFSRVDQHARTNTYCCNSRKRPDYSRDRAGVAISAQSGTATYRSEEPDRVRSPNAMATNPSRC